MIDIANDRYSFFFTDMDATIKPLSFNYTTHSMSLELELEVLHSLSIALELEAHS